MNIPIKILLVDDEVRNLEALESILGSPDYQLIRAQTPDEALLALVQNDFAAIILDIQMPGMSGLDLAQLIKQRKRNRHIPILFLTAYFHEDKDILSGYTAGAVDYLTKPINPQILKSKIGVFVELFRTTRALAAANITLEREVDERQKAELAHARLAAIVESSSDAIFSRTLDGTITSWNKGAERTFGYSSEEILGGSISRLIPEDRLSDLPPIHERVLRGEIVEPFETIGLCKEGQPIDVSVTMSPIRDAAGCVVGLSAIMRDIGERKRLEAEILQAGERERRRIAQDLHDGLGQHLAGVSWLSDVLKKDLTERGTPGALEAARISGLLNAAVAQTRELARGLHPVASSSRGLMLALEALAASITDVFKVPCRFVCGRAVFVKANPVATHLYRIAQEAVNNALKHARPRNIEIELAIVANRLVLTVSDDGRGIQNDGMAQNGLGMKIMNYRADMIGGRLLIQRRAGQGTSVVCSVPAPTRARKNEQAEKNSKPLRAAKDLHLI
jgi:PAS domain S-box-containing protein